MVSVDGAFTGGVGLAAILGFLLALTGLVGGAFFAWTQAPVVGGEWWFYIRITATLIGALIGAKIGAIVGYFVGLIGGGIVGGLLG